MDGGFQGSSETSFSPPPALQGFLPKGKHGRCSRSDGDAGFTTAVAHLHEEALGLGSLASSHALEGGILSSIDLHVTQAGEVRSFGCQGEVAKWLSNMGTNSSIAARVLPQPKIPPRMPGLEPSSGQA